MRKLKLQMNLALDNKWDSGMSDFSIDNLKSVDCILHGRKTGEGFIPYWTEIANNPNDAEYKLGRRFADIPNVVFSNTLKVSQWDNTTIIGGDIKVAIEALKKKNGKDILVYGGANFVSSLIKKNLIDEFNFFIHRNAIGNGLKIFTDTTKLKLINSKSFECGIVANHYQPDNK